MNTRETLSEFISVELLDGAPIGADEHLLGDGTIDSLGMLRLVAFAEASFCVKIPPADFTIENFRTIDALGGYLERLVAAGGDSTGGG